MRYKLTTDTLPRVNELCQLIATTRAGLAGLGLEAHREWDRLRPRFPSEDDLYQGYISLSDLEVEDLHANLRRFGEKAPSPLARRSSPRLVPSSAVAIAA